MPTKKKWPRFEVERAVRADRTLPSNTKLVILMLGTYANERGQAHPGQDTLAADCGWAGPHASRSVRRALAPVRGKYVTVHQGGDGRPALYCLTLPGERCGHDRLREDLEANSPDAGVRPEVDSARSSVAAARTSVTFSPDTGGSSPDAGVRQSLQSTKDRSLGEQEQLSPEIRTSELASAAIKLDLRNMPPMVLDVIEAIALDLLGGERNGLVDWSFDGVTYTGLRAEIDEMSSPEVLREVLGAIDMVRVGRGE